jgi:hypothetical protein
LADDFLADAQSAALLNGLNVEFILDGNGNPGAASCLTDLWRPLFSVYVSGDDPAAAFNDSDPSLGYDRLVVLNQRLSDWPASAAAGFGKFAAGDRPYVVWEPSDQEGMLEVGAVYAASGEVHPPGLAWAINTDPAQWAVYTGAVTGNAWNDALAAGGLESGAGGGGDVSLRAVAFAAVGGLATALPEGVDAVGVTAWAGGDGTLRYSAFGFGNATGGPRVDLGNGTLPLPAAAAGRAANGAANWTAGAAADNSTDNSTTSLSLVGLWAFNGPRPFSGGEAPQLLGCELFDDASGAGAGSVVFAVSAAVETTSGQPILLWTPVAAHPPPLPPPWAAAARDRSEVGVWASFASSAVVLSDGRQAHLWVGGPVWDASGCALTLFAAWFDSVSPWAEVCLVEGSAMRLKGSSLAIAAAAGAAGAGGAAGAAVVSVAVVYAVNGTVFGASACLEPGPGLDAAAVTVNDPAGWGSAARRRQGKRRDAAGAADADGGGSPAAAAADPVGSTQPLPLYVGTNAGVALAAAASAGGEPALVVAIGGSSCLNSEAANKAAGVGLCDAMPPRPATRSATGTAYLAYVGGGLGAWTSQLLGDEPGVWRADGTGGASPCSRLTAAGMFGMGRSPAPALLLRKSLESHSEAVEAASTGSATVASFVAHLGAVAEGRGSTVPDPDGCGAALPTAQGALVLSSWPLPQSYFAASTALSC